MQGELKQHPRNPCPRESRARGRKGPATGKGHAPTHGSTALVRGSTLIETLVMMLVAGIVFLAVMDGLTLFSRLQARRTEALLEAGRRTEGYYRLVALVTAADSIRAKGPGQLTQFRGGRSAELSLCDSVITYRIGAFRDTLLDGVAALRLEEYAAQPDTVEIGFCGAFTVRLAVKPPGRQYCAELKKIEDGYGYEE